MGSKRWPGKVLADVAGMPMILRVVKQCMAAHQSDIIAAIPDKGNDDLRVLLDNYCIDIYEGSADDLIDRYICASGNYGGVIRVTGDCPFVFPTEIENIDILASTGVYDFISNGFPIGRTTPDGTDVEYYSQRLLLWMDRNAVDPLYREHLPLYIYDNLNEVSRQFKIKRVDWPIDLSHIKFSIDTPADLERVLKMLPKGTQ